ncbi:hypothetical protein [Deefgea salmonis]|uniref:Uncharacterized protein n=1 Tax=Deefgea salmonis TaxID=2875502 RepID=A0ABS8BH09_9NEIS|nr:hypothetical protein [Deefgea salmonis]MCB5194996.1 hypothetical protein [Deefgea salmonis]
MKILPIVAICLPLVVQAEDVFHGYEAYYSTLPARLFLGERHDLQLDSITESNDLAYAWQGSEAGAQHSATLRGGRIKVDGKFLKNRSVKAFPGEVVDAGDLGRGSSVFFAKGWACLEGVAPSASGTAVRHKSVYLIQLDKQHPKAWKLASLFASCSNIRKNMDAITFDKAEYLYQEGSDTPTGIAFTEYAIQGNGFVQVGNERKASFVEAGNVYKFSLK